MLASRFRLASHFRRPLCRAISSLSSNPNIKVFPNPLNPSSSHILTLLSTDPPSPSLAIGTTTAVPPTPRSFTQNARFLAILNEVLEKHAQHDEDLQAAALAFASPGGFGLGGGGKGNAQGGAGGGGTGGWVHLSDRRNPPDYGRIAWPEDIFGSVQVDGNGEIEGNFQASGTYRIVTNDGILGLSPFLTGKLVDRLRQEEQKEKGS